MCKIKTKSILNILKPGTVKPPTQSKIAFKHRENIAEYLEACQKVFGLKATTLFQTVDLYEEKNLNLVITSIHVLATEAAKQPGYTGPRIKEVVASANNALFTTAASYVSGLPPIEESKEVSEEEKLMIEWINSHLKAINIQIDRISELRNGRIIINLLEYFTGIPRLGTYESNPSNLWHCMTNAAFILKFIHQQTGEVCPNCRAIEITMSRFSALISLLSFVRSKFDRDFVFKSQNCKQMFHFHLPT